MWPFTRKKKPEAERKTASPIPTLYPRTAPYRGYVSPGPAPAPSPAPSRSSEGDFFTSMAIAEATGNPMLGYLAGGSLTGAIVGESIAESSHHSGSSFDGGHGGDFGGGGSSGDYSSSSDSCSSSSDSSSSFDSGGSCSSGSDSY